MKILAIETSCDETAIAIVEASRGVKNPSFRILSNVVASQVKLHAKFGGVVPNLAKREHEKNLPLVLQQALREANIFVAYHVARSTYQGKGIDAIAITVGPGLAPALWVGVNFAKELAQKWKKPIIPVNHMDGHIASVLLQQNRGISNSQFIISKQIPNSPPSLSELRRASKFQIPNDLGFRISNLKFPAIALLVSGGHTELVFMKGWRNKKIIGETLDDAAGEAFDKVARMLEFSYPGGPHIAASAQHAQTIAEKTRNNTETESPCESARELRLPRPMIHTKDYNFSFSGLKTAVLYLVEKLKKQGIPIKQMRPIIAKEFQDAVVDVLVAKTIRAAKEYRVKTVILGGGVAANQQLRERLGNEIKNNFPATCYLLPATQLTGDNAAMIAAAAYLMGKKTSWTKLEAIDTLRI